MLENNNQSMQTTVETFIVEETSSLIHDNDALQRWNESVEALGLQGQKTVIQKEKSPIPFLWMNSALIATFETLCPTKVKVEQYDKSPIPVEILDLLKLSKNEGYFNEVEIWYNEVDKDPVCVGYHFGERSARETDFWKKAYAEKYLIGRWADVKASIDTLTKKARQIFIQNTKSRLSLEIRQKQREIEDMEELANQKFGGAMPVTDLPF
jgi:high-affinity Fe2+/Pb2+ permease